MATSLKNLRAIWLSEKKLISRPGPSDAITFISQLYTGSISDREIVLRSSLLSQKFEDGESVMADKGFQIQDILPLRVKLYIPPFLGRNSQMSAEDVI